VTPAEFFKDAQSVETPSGQISYVEQGSGDVALFVHGVLLNGWLWRHQLEEFSDIRRCIAIDLLAHGRTQISSDQDVSVTANAHMLAQFLDALQITQVDLVGNDTGGGICQIFTALYPDRVRTLTLTNCDTHDNWPPEGFKPFVEMVKAGGLAKTLAAMLKDKNVYRSSQALGPAYERPEEVSDETIDTYLQPFVGTKQRMQDLERFVKAFDNKHTVSIEPKLRALRTNVLIVWGDDDVYFDVKWSMWLVKTLQGATRRVVLHGARIFFPEERSKQFNRELATFWMR
jgi:pimeloyl-ACP methyl ester carboxylesterase